MPSPENSAEQGANPPRHNRPASWAAFRALRQRPAPQPYRPHGNRKHGAYTKAARESRALVRYCVRVIRTGRGDLATYYGPQPVAPGWRGFRDGRGAV